MMRRAQIGIGTLIVFMAMILVASIAAGVMLRVSGALQQKAMVTGEQSTKEVATSVKVTEIVGYSDAVNITAIGLSIELASGSEPVRYEDLLMSYHSGNIYIPGILHELAPGAGENNYTIIFIRNATNDYILERGEVAQLWFNLSANPTAAPLRPFGEFTIMLLPRAGQPAIVTKTVPSAINQRYILEWG